MLNRVLVSAAFGATLTHAQWASTSTEYHNSISCTTEYGSSWVHPIPTSYSRTDSTISSFAPVETITVTEYVQVSTVATPVTYWSNVYETETVSLDATTQTVRETTTNYFKTVTVGETACTNGVAPETTVTTYTGVYTPIPGQNTVLPSTYETSNSCFVTGIIVEHIFPTTVGGTVTESVTTTTASPTMWTTTTYHFTVTKYASTVTTTAAPLTVYNVDYRTAVTTTISTACAPTATATYAAQCAPQNLIAEMDGHGLSLPVYGANVTTGSSHSSLADMDPSACCQLCVDNDGCEATEYFAMSNICSLVFSYGGGDDCPTVLKYHAIDLPDAPTKPRQGMVYAVGAGCGTIEYTGVQGA